MKMLTKRHLKFVVSWSAKIGMEIDEQGVISLRGCAYRFAGGTLRPLQFTRNCHGLSADAGFRFEFYCNRCGKHCIQQ